jgi:hypothetical protein
MKIIEYVFIVVGKGILQRTALCKRIFDLIHHPLEKSD